MDFQKAHLGRKPLGRNGEGKTASIRAGRIQYVARCPNRNPSTRHATVQIECWDSIGHSFWNRDFCEAHAKPLIRFNWDQDLQSLVSFSRFCFAREYQIRNPSIRQNAARLRRGRGHAYSQSFYLLQLDLAARIEHCLNAVG